MPFVDKEDLSGLCTTLYGSGSGYDTCNDVVNKISDNEDLYAQMNENDQLKDLYSQLVGVKQEDSQIEIQHAKFTQAKTGTVSTVNYWLFLIFYLACLGFAAMLFFFSKSPAILAMSVYMKIVLILVALTYPIWIQIVDQIVVFLLRYLYALIFGMPYTKNVRQ